MLTFIVVFDETTGGPSSPPEIDTVEYATAEEALKAFDEDDRALYCAVVLKAR